MKKIAITIVLVAALNSGRVVGEDLEKKTTAVRPAPPNSGATGIKRSQLRRPPIQKKQPAPKIPKKVVVETRQPAKPLSQRRPGEPVYPTSAKPTCRCLKGGVYSSDETTQAACSASNGTWRCVGLRSASTIRLV